MMIVLMKFSVTMWLYKDSDFKGFTEVSWSAMYDKAHMVSSDERVCLKL